MVVSLYPENCASALQALDVVVNGPIKRTLRAARATKAREALLRRCAALKSSTREEQRDASLKPQTPKAHKSMHELFKRFETDMKTEKARSSVAKSLLDAGAGPNDDGARARDVAATRGPQ